jgi:two-component system cell cycle sensor histidine kinase PleC
MSARALQGGIALTNGAPAGPVEIHADARAVRQILLNLLSNAVKFTPRGGRVTTFLTHQLSGEVAFGVSDTGFGIHEEDIEHVFEKFGQGRHDVVTQDKGTGLGLPIVKGLVTAHGGRVELRSRKGEGTRVTVSLPASRLVSGTALQAAS